jgi:putative ABC transport system permease protein
VNRGTVDTIMVKVSSPAARSAVQDRMATLLRMRHRLRNGAEDDFQIRDLASIASAQSEASRSLTIMLAAVAAVSLVVGGISIMNIMLISVHERTREIGLRMALGARRRDIRRQFLVEVAIVCAIGGVVGVIIGTGAALAISQYAGWDVHVSPEVAFASVSFATAIGVFFGLYPANRAGRMNPIAALRFE